MASGTWGTGSWGQNQWNDTANPTFTVTGIALTASLGDESSSTEINVGWGRQEWGLQGWGIAGTTIPTGISATFNLGSVTTSIDVDTGPSTNNNQLLTAALGNVTGIGSAEVPVTGFPLTANLGTVDASPDAMPTSVAATMGLGTVEAFNLAGWGRLQWGINDWGDAGSSVIASVSGIAMTAALGNETITANANVTANTLNVAQLTLGIVDPAPDASITGNGAILSLGTLGMQGDVSPNVTGIAMSAVLGNETIDLNQQVDVTGNPLLARVASVTAFTDVTATFNGFGLTTTLGSGNALIWNQINTGSAPIDPPGWREVVA
jgi:hypothetical protein